MNGSSRWRVLAVLMAGIMAGTMLLTPVGAHINQSGKHVGLHAWKEYIAKKVYTRSASRRIFQSTCQPGSVLAYVSAHGDAITAGTGFAVRDGVQYNCAGGPIEIAKVGTGNYTVKVPGLAFRRGTSLNVRDYNVQVTVGAQRIAGHAAGGDTYRFETAAPDGTPADAKFNVTVFHAERVPS